MEKSNLIGALTSIGFLTSAILVFVFRLLGKPEFGKWIGYFEFLLGLPLVWLLFKAAAEKRPALYFIQIALVLAWLLLELCLDYVFKIDFRQIRWLLITYVILFFAAAGGLVGVASNAGKNWSIAAIILFIMMAVLTFIQRKITGL